MYTLHFTTYNGVIEARNGMNSSVRISPLNNLSLRQTVRLLAIRSHLSPPTSPALSPSVFSRAAKAKMSSSSSPSIPDSMKGVLIEKTGGTEVLQYRDDLRVPVPKEGEVLVKIEFIGINFIDTYRNPPCLFDIESSLNKKTATSDQVSISPQNPRS